MWLLGRRADKRGGYSKALKISRCPGIAIRIQLAFAVRSGSMPDHLLRPDDVIENVAVVETVDVVLTTGSEFAGPSAAVHVVPGAKQHFSLNVRKKK